MNRIDLSKMVVCLLVTMWQPADAFSMGHCPGSRKSAISRYSPASLSATKEEVLVSLNSVSNAVVSVARRLGSDTLSGHKIVVAGANGQTGRKILERLISSTTKFDVVGGVRNVNVASSHMSKSMTVIRGARFEKIDSVDLSAVTLRSMDVVRDSVDDLTTALKGTNTLVISIGFVTRFQMLGNPLAMKAAARAVDNIGTCKLVDAAKKAGVKRVVMLSSILANGRSWGQEGQPGFFVTNALGNVLDQKLIAETHLKTSGIDYTILRTGSLKTAPPTGTLGIFAEDTLNDGEISRDHVADAVVMCLANSKYSKKVIELKETRKQSEYYM